MRSWQTIEVGLPAGGRLPFLPLYRADMIRLYGVDFISLRPPFAAQIIPCAAIERRAEQPRLFGISSGAGRLADRLAGAGRWPPGPPFVNKPGRGHNAYKGGACNPDPGPEVAGHFRYGVFADKPSHYVRACGSDHVRKTVHEPHRLAVGFHRNISAGRLMAGPQAMLEKKPAPVRVRSIIQGATPFDSLPV